MQASNQILTTEPTLASMTGASRQKLHSFPEEKFNLMSLYPRLLHCGVSYSDLERIQKTSPDRLSFSRVMTGLADNWKSSAAKAWKQGRVETPREHWKRAADYYHHAQLDLPEAPLKKRLRRASRACYQHCAPLLDPPAVRCHVPFQSYHLPGYLRVRRPGGACVILIGGLDSAKEVELHYLAETFLRRSCSVFYFDGPGQGEIHCTTSMSAGFENAVSSVIDFLRKDPRVGVASIGCFGLGLGGHLACRAAACDPRIDACISVSGFFDAQIVSALPPPAQITLLKAFGISTGDLANLSSQLSLAPLQGRMKAPCLIVHGNSDPLISASQASALEKWACGPVDKLMLEGGEHGCFNRFHECLPVIGDWMTKWLIHRNTQRVAVI